VGSCRFKLLDDGEVELDIDFGVTRDADSWLEGLDDPLMFVTGAAGFIGRYMVELLVGLGHRVFATDLGGRPRYLLHERFRDVAYERADLREEDDIFALMRRARPAVVFHVAALFDFSAPVELLDEINVAGAERVAEAASDSGVRRMVHWSTGSVYAPSSEPVSETGPKAPGDAYARSKLEGERAVFAFHDAPRFEVYSVRPAMVAGVLSHYGSGLVMRLMHEGYLIGPPQKRGMTTAIVNARDVASCAYLIARAKLDLPAESPDDTAFNASADPTDLEAMMRTIGGLLPRRHILGVRTKLAEIISFGYQERMRLPDRVVNLIGHASRAVTRALGRVRFDSLQPKVPPATVSYLTQPYNMSNAKARELLGWNPDPLETDIDETVRYYEATGWTGFEKVSRPSEPRDSVAFEEARAVVEAFRAPAGGEEERPLRVASLGLDIDPHSLRTLVRSAESNVLARVYRGSLLDLIGIALPWAVLHALEDAALFLKYSYANRYDRRGLPEADVFGLLRACAGLDRDRFVSWMLMADVAAFIEGLHDSRDSLRRITDLLPDGLYGLVVATDFGDLVLELRKDGDTRALSSVEEGTDPIPRRLPLAERVEKLKVLRGMRLALGISFDDLTRLVWDTGARDLVDTASAFVCSPSDLIQRLSGKVEGEGWTLVLFEDESAQLSLGIDLGDGRGVCSPERLGALEIERSLVGHEGFVAALEGATSGREKVKVYPAAEFRKLLADATAPGVVARFLGR
jgi:nucleoside-diphosphate-sugar epimerase